jgi:hypothetical protein
MIQDPEGNDITEPAGTYYGTVVNRVGVRYEPTRSLQLNAVIT